MGAIFKLRHANIFAYLTTNTKTAPRVLKSELSEFLQLLIDKSDYYFVSEPGFRDWSKQLSNIALEAVSILKDDWSDRRYTKPKPAGMIFEAFQSFEGFLKTDWGPSSDAYLGDYVLPSHKVERLLEPLRNSFEHTVYALAVGHGEEMRDKALELSRVRLKGKLLVLIPEISEPAYRPRNLTVTDPVSVFSHCLHASPRWPGFLFWTSTNSTAFASLSSVDELVAEFASVFSATVKKGENVIDKVSKIFNRWESKVESPSRRLLQLSDLHFGTKDANENVAILEAELHSAIKSVDRVVITGDLCDTPKSAFATMFANFRNRLTLFAKGTEPIVITGNHDQRWSGIFGKNYEQVARIGPGRIEVDDNCKMIFVCFNSSEKGFLAGGKISKTQYRALGGELRNLLEARPELKSYLLIALVHHHPFSFYDPVSWWEKALYKIRISLEPTVVLKNPKYLHEWCANWNIKTILHGHKHKARYVERAVGQGSEEMWLSAIGCGSSLGAEGSPVSYILLEWEPNSRKWVASFFESREGGAFKEISVSVSR